MNVTISKNRGKKNKNAFDVKQELRFCEHANKLLRMSGAGIVVEWGESA
jgi:hypothetical protein